MTTGAPPAADLTARAEEALLGSLISDPSQLAAVSGLDASMFTDPGRQAVWAGINRLREVAEGASGREFADLVLATTDDPAITGEYLTRLALSAPTPGAGSTYARLVAEAALTRAVSGQLSRADVVRGGAEVQTGISYSACVSAARSALGGNLAASSAAPAGERALREEQFIAGILGQHGLMDWIYLDPDILTTPGLRTIYQAAMTARRLGEPTDELTLTWRAASIVAHGDYTAGRTTTPDTVAAAIPAGTIARLAATRVDPLTALEAGRDLLAEHTRERIAAERAAAREARRHAPASYGGTAKGRLRDARSQDPALLQHPPAQNGPRHGPQLSQEGS